MDLSDLAGGLTTVLSSSGVRAIVGGVFGWLNRREDRKARAADQEHERNMVGLRANANQQESEARAFEESQKGLSRVGDAIKSIVRPVITGVLMWMVYDILQQMQSLQINFAALVNQDPSLAIELYRQIVLNVISLAATATAWWFASRPSAITYRPPTRTNTNQGGLP